MMTSSTSSTPLLLLRVASWRLRKRYCSSLKRGDSPLEIKHHDFEACTIPCLLRSRRSLAPCLFPQMQGIKVQNHHQTMCRLFPIFIMCSIRKYFIVIALSTAIFPSLMFAAYLSHLIIVVTFPCCFFSLCALPMETHNFHLRSYVHPINSSVGY